MSLYDLKEKEALILGTYYMFIIMLSNTFCHLFLTQSLKSNFF